MNLEGRRRSTNVEDRRGQSGGGGLGFGGGGFNFGKGGMGIGGLIVVGLIYMLMGGNVGDLLNGAMSNGAVSNTQTTAYKSSEEEEQLKEFTEKVLGSTEDVWTKVFQEQGLGEYRMPTLVLCTGTVNTACGSASSEQVGPFYCSGDEKLYVNLQFLATMKQQFGTAGDFAYAYVIAHEVGHHVQHLLGVLHKGNKYFPNETENQTSVRTELQADFLAGVWGYNEDKIFGSLEKGDKEEAYDIAAQIGDDILQKRFQGTVNEEAFTHGRAKQRQRWLKKGLDSGMVKDGNTFAVPYNDL
ncbi:MAG: neutral zinc metallopeptidase [Bacteroidaceae bacterium]|nr:neutral zinc metallopeptidase [Bacteroidaceae bacterium]